MRRSLIAAGCALASLATSLFSGCISSSGNGAGADDAATSDANTPVPTEDSGAPDQAAPPTPDAGSPDATLPTSDAGPAPIDAGPVDAGGDANDAAVPIPDAGTANVRFANFVPDLATAVDVCAAAQGAPLQGPFLKAAGVTAGLAYGQLTQYVTVPLVTYVHVRVVAAGSTDCSTPLLPDYQNLPITVAQQATVALIGSTSDAGAHAPELVAYPDDPPSSGFPTLGSRVRIIHAAPFSPATDFEIGAGSTYVYKQQQAVPFGAATSAATTVAGGYTPDSNGYFVSAFDSAQITAVEGTDVASFATGSGGYSAGATAFLVGIPGSATTPLEMISCDDTAAPSNFMTPCQIHAGPPILSVLRLANFAPSLPAIDFCLALEGVPATKLGPILRQAGADAGVAYDQLSGDITGALGPIPTDTAFIFSYVPAGQPCTATPLFTLDQYVYGLYRGNTPSPITTTIPIVEGTGTTDYWSFPANVAPTSSSPGLAEIALYTNSLVDDDPPDVPLYDVYDTPLDGGVQTFASNLIDNDEAFQFLNAGTYAMRVAAVDGGATLYSQTGMVFNANESWGLWLRDDLTAGITVTRCNLGQLDAGAMTTCAQ